MNNEYKGKVMWSHLDANGHMRHSAYADFASQARIAILDEQGLDLGTFQRLKIGPILFREELIYLREVGVNENLRITIELTKARGDGSRWSIRHEIFRSDGVKAAVVNVDGAWMDLAKRKLTVLPDELQDLFMHISRSENFVEEEIK
ncbi:acyl-CoA thioesterase [Pontibacter rugosus]|uniref:Acyl-CoA thioesterase n=1 Tax=Pontibacter rugosus TaxID=1745966 RepID=A0ABW3SSX8_9BACT